MDGIFAALPRADALPLLLREIYEGLGYKKYTMDTFETYDLYSENRSYLKNEGIITFTDPRGRLMALKPDVTMSIVKNTSDGALRKLFYCENVFRADSARRECREISQMGLEFIGGQDVYAEAEVIGLALRSLQTIAGEYVLDVSHMGFIAPFLTSLGLEGELRGRAVAALEHKSAHELTAVAELAGLGAEQAQRLVCLRGLAGPFAGTLEKARLLAAGDGAMDAALNDLAQLYRVLEAMELSQNVRLDFSVMNDVDYYNGVIFRGYVSGVPRAVLAGGRYDSLLRRFGKTQAALGFAVYLGELDRALHETPDWDVDALLIYGGADPAMTARAVESLRCASPSVLAVRMRPQGLRAKQVFVLAEDGRILEVTAHA